MNRHELEATISGFQRGFDEIADVLADDVLSAEAKVSAIEAIVEDSDDESFDDGDGD